MTSRLSVFFVFLVSFTLLFLDVGCHHSTEPPPPSGPDTTSHDFTWTTFELGEGNSSILNDVAIINDTLVYAVGEVYLKNSTGQIDPNPYNLVEGGMGWRLKRATVNFRGSQITLPLYGIFAFSQEDIWNVGSLPIHGNGQNWAVFDLRSMPGFESISVEKAWGTNSQNMYFAGLGGSLVHYNGSSWQKIESGTSLPFQDIWGGVRSDGTAEIVAVASNLSEVPSGKRLVQVQATSAVQLPDTGLAYFLRGVWFVPEQKYYVVGAGIHWNSAIGRTNPWSVYPSGQVTSQASLAVRGNSLNDIFVVGSFGEIAHFNGISWRTYWDQVPYQYGSFYGVAVKGNLVIAVGQLYSKAWIAVGRR